MARRNPAGQGLTRYAYLQENKDEHQMGMVNVSKLMTTGLVGGVCCACIATCLLQCVCQVYVDATAYQW